MKEKTANEMFEELGYNVCIEEINPYNGKKYIYCKNIKEYKVIEIVAYDYIRIVENVGLSTERACDIEWNELTTINKKIKELKWI